LKEACDKAQKAHDHYAVMLASQSSGNNCYVGQLLLQQLDRWQEVKADQFIANNRLALYSHVAGVPIWAGSLSVLNTCDGLDWLRSLGLHLWYFTSPSASISDALASYEEAFTVGDEQVISFIDSRAVICLELGNITICIYSFTKAWLPLICSS
jgi:nuclear pore complex protein Nup98-Nup96